MNPNEAVRKLTNYDYVKGLQRDMKIVFETPQGKEVMDFLEKNCCWYHSIFNPQSKEMTLINDGKRQVIATIKTLLEYSAEEIVTIAQSQEE